MTVLSSDSTLAIPAVLAVVRGEQVEVAPATLEMLAERRAQIERHLNERNEPAYGFNRGFGHNVDRKVDRQFLLELQRNLIRSHSAGVGPAAPREVVRAAMVLRLQALIRGHSAIRPVVARTLAALLNAGIVPVVPAFGSVGASGDLAPLSHIALALMGEGEVTVGASDAPVPAAAALHDAGIEPLILEMKEGLALINGVQYSTAFAALAYERVMEQLKTAALATAMTAQVMLGSDTPFLPEFHELRPHRGARVVARWIWDLMQESPLRRSHESYAVDGEVQDPYNLRCAAQILGTCFDLLEEARETFETEMNSVTDNPLLLRDEHGSFTRIVSGGHFHGMPVAVKLYNLVQAVAIMARLSNMRCARYVDEARNKQLGSDLVWPALSEAEKASSSGMMIPEYVSAALTNYIWGATTPSHLFSISTDAGQEDHVSMSAGLAVRLWETLPRLSELLGIELAYAVQAAAIRKLSPVIPSKRLPDELHDGAVRAAKEQLLSAVSAAVSETPFTPRVEVHLDYRVQRSDHAMSPVCEEVARAIEAVFPPVQRDRELSSQLRKLAGLVAEGRLLQIAERRVQLRTANE